MLNEELIRNRSFQRQWVSEYHAEHDLLMSEVMICLGNDPRLEGLVTVSGGTAIHFLHSKSPGRFSEDVDCITPSLASQILLAKRLREVLKEHCEKTGLQFTWKHRISKYIGYRLLYQVGTSPDIKAVKKAAKVETSHSQPALSEMAEKVNF